MSTVLHSSNSKADVGALYFSDARKIFLLTYADESSMSIHVKRLGMYADRDHSTVVYSVQRGRTTVGV